VKATSALLLRTATKVLNARDLDALGDAEAPDGKFDVIVIDPPWPMQKIERDVRPHQAGDARVKFLCHRRGEEGARAIERARQEAAERANEARAVAIKAQDRDEASRFSAGAATIDGNNGAGPPNRSAGLVAAKLGIGPGTHSACSWATRRRSHEVAQGRVRLRRPKQVVRRVREATRSPRRGARRRGLPAKPPPC
jgi:hypothetical protein